MVDGERESLLGRKRIRRVTSEVQPDGASERVIEAHKNKTEKGGGKQGEASQKKWRALEGEEGEQKEQN